MWVHAKPAAVIFIGFGLCAHAAQMAHTAQAAQKAKPAVELADRFAAPAEQARNEDAEAAERKRDPDSESAPKANSEPPGADYEAELLDRARRELLREQAKRAGAESGKSLRRHAPVAALTGPTMLVQRTAWSRRRMVRPRRSENRSTMSQRA